MRSQSRLFLGVVIVSLGWSVATVGELIQSSRLAAVQGSETVAGCYFCSDNTVVFRECLHINDAGGKAKDAACITDKCIQNTARWFECAETPPSGKDGCEVTLDKLGIYRNQIVYNHANLDCGPTYDKVPITPRGKCAPTAPSANGKCFIDACSGTEWNGTYQKDFTGLWRCK